MSSKNFMAYGDAETIFTGFANKINANTKGVAEQKVLLPSTVGWTGKNLLENLGTSQEINDVVFTIYDDGSVKAHGTASANATLYLTSKALNAGFLSSLSGKSVILSGGHSDNKRVQMWSTNGGVVYSGTGEITIDVTSSIASSADYNIVINILQGQVCDNEMFYPMIRDSRITDSTYEPYHKSVEECKADNTVIAPVESGTTASQAYAQGAHFIKDGAFCTAITSIASGATLTKNTNYTEGDVASALSSGGGGEVYPAVGTEAKIGTWAGYDLYRQMFRKTSTYKNTDVSMGVLTLGYYIVAVQGYYKDYGNGYISALPEYASVNNSLKTARVTTYEDVKNNNIVIEVENTFLGADLDYIVIVDYLKSAPTS